MILKFGEVVEVPRGRVERCPSFRTAAPSILRRSSCYEDRQDAVASGTFRSRIFASTGEFARARFNALFSSHSSAAAQFLKWRALADRSSFSSMYLIIQSFVKFGCSGGVNVDQVSKRARIEMVQYSNQSILAGTRAPLRTWLMKIGADVSQDLVENHGPELEPEISSRLRGSLSACLSGLIRKVDDDAIVEWGIRQNELLLLRTRKTCHLAIQVVHGMAQARQLLFLSKRFAHLDRPRAVKLRHKFIALKVPT